MPYVDFHFLFLIILARIGNDVANQTFNSFAPRRFHCEFRLVHFKLILVTDDWSISCEIAPETNVNVS